MSEINKFYEEIILNKIQDNFGHEVFTPGLERTGPIYRPKIEKIKSNGTKVIIVGGTNGKGQTCHSIGHYLKLDLKAFALWTSPHILSIRERFNHNGQDISYEELDQLIDKNIKIIRNEKFKVSFYEFLFLVFLDWIENFKLDFLILEVGLGGKLDAVNHFDCDLALITSISRDHQAILGNSYKKILDEKLGITRTKKQLITSFQLNFLIENTVEFTNRNEIPYKNILPQNDYFNSNIEMAKEAVKFFGIMPNIQNELPLFKGREEVIKIGNLELVFIGAHNPEGIRLTMEKLKDSGEHFDRLLLSFSKRSDQDLVGMVKSILEHTDIFSSISMTYFIHPKAISLEILQDVLIPICNNKINLDLDWKTLINGFKNQPQKNRILVAGSYYFIGEVQSFILNN